MAKKRKSEDESQLEVYFLEQWLTKYPTHRPAREYHFHPTRRFRFDFAWPKERVAVEVQGMGPGHCGLLGMTKDYARHMEAMLLNWQVVYLTSTLLKKDDSYNNIAKLLGLPPLYFRPVSTKYVPLSKRKSWR